MSLFVYYYMQQKDVLTELYSYISSDPKPPDLKQTECTLKYLEACNLSDYLATTRFHQRRDRFY